MFLGYQNGQIKFYTENVFDEPTIEKWEETQDEYISDGECYVLKDKAWEEKQAQAEKERIQELFMTRSDFFDGTIDAWGIGEDELLLVIKQVLGSLPFEDKTKLKALNNFKNALNFYRKHTLFSLLVGNPIQLTETIQVILTDESLDKYFDEVNKGNKETAWQYLPQPIEIPLPKVDLLVENDEELPTNEVALPETPTEE